MTGTLIIGAGHAGVQLAASLRDLGYREPIRLVGEEAHDPYQRPPLSKSYLKDPAPEHVRLRPREFYVRHEIELITGTRIDRLDLDAGSATTTDGRRLPFERVALTTGSAARRLRVPGADFSGVHCLRSAADATAIKAAIREQSARPGRAVVVGAGLIGLETAAALRTFGIEVTVVEAAERILSTVASRGCAALVAAALAAHGVEVRTGTSVARFGSAADRRRVGHVVLNDQTELECDLVVLGIGVVPRTELASAAGLRTTPLGIVVDENGRTSHPRAFAAGDATDQPHPLSPGVRVRLESLQNAVDQARRAAQAIVDPVRTLRPMPPWGWSDLFGHRLQFLGMPAGWDSDLPIADEGRFVNLLFQADRLVGAECVDAPREFMQLRQALSGGLALGRSDLVSTARPLNAVLAEQIAAARQRGPALR